MYTSLYAAAPVELQHRASMSRTTGKLSRSFIVYAPAPDRVMSVAVRLTKLFEACMKPIDDVAENVVGARTGAAAPAPWIFAYATQCSYGIAVAGLSLWFMAVLLTAARSRSCSRAPCS